MKTKRHPDEFKIEAVRQISEAGHGVYDVAQRLGITTNSLYRWVKEFGPESSTYLKEQAESDEVRRLK